MGNERLTDEELDSLDQWAGCDLGGADQRQIWAATSELRERRALDLSDEEREALDWVRHQCKRAEHGHPTYKTKTALAILDRLLSQGGRR